MAENTNGDENTNEMNNKNSGGANQGTKAGSDEELQRVTEEVQNQMEQLKKDYLYLRAEFDTYRRNAIKERSDILKYGAERLACDLLGVLDNFERALETEVNSENFESFVEGVKLTAKELQSALNRNGIEEVPSQGVAFDPAVHEALTSEETDEVAPGHIYRVFKKAYKIHDRILRPAQVVVAKEKS